MTAETVRCFDALAADAQWYTFTPNERRITDEFVRRWGIRPGDWVLEPGCGSGRLTVILAALTGPEGRVLAFDASREFIRAAARRGMPAHVTLHAFRMETAPLPQASFEHVVCFNAFPHLVPQERTAYRLAGALRPGGVLWIAHTCSRGFVNGVHRQGPASLRNHLLPAPRVLDRLLRGAGLGEVEIEDGADRFLARAVHPAPVFAGPPVDRHA
jgi:demethylmenaquinone methyltransferase/2-methoxy-6-polyprenyl-1,4-benzoquinol methylase